MFLRNKFLNTASFLFAADGERSAADIERDNIPVQTIEPEKDDKDGKPASDKEGDNESGETAEGDDDENEEEKEEVEEEKEPEKEASEEDKAFERERTKMQKRIDRLSAKQKTTEAENIELKRLLDAKVKDGDVPLTEEEVERRAELKAQEKADLKEFNNAQERLIKEASKVDKDFMKNVKGMAEEIGLIPPVMIAILDDLDEKGKVLDYLTKNVDETEEIYKMSEAKMAVALAKIETKLSKRPPAKAISRVPEPNKPLGGGSKAPSTLNDSMSDEDWINKRNAEIAAKRRA
jgi:hypothetical protein